MSGRLRSHAVERLHGRSLVTEDLGEPDLAVSVEVPALVVGDGHGLALRGIGGRDGRLPIEIHADRPVRLPGLGVDARQQPQVLGDQVEVVLGEGVRPAVDLVLERRRLGLAEGGRPPAGAVGEMSPNGRDVLIVEVTDQARGGLAVLLEQRIRFEDPPPADGAQAANRKAGRERKARRFMGFGVQVCRSMRR